MHLDLYSFFVFIATSAIFMGVGLLIAWRHYIKEIKGGYRWAIGLMILGVGCIMPLIRHITHNQAPAGSGAAFILLAVACFFHALVEFKESHTPVRWAYYLVALSFVLQLYSAFILNSFAIKIVIASISGAILFFANGFLLLKNGNIPISHKITGYSFALVSVLLTIRAGYYLIADIPPIQAAGEHPNVMQDISSITLNLSIIAGTFGFLLMCIDKYVMAQKQTQLAKQEVLERLEKIASQVPGVVYQFKMSSDGVFNVSYCSDGIYDIFKLTPEDVYKNVSLIFDRVFVEDYEFFMTSIKESAKYLTRWCCQFRVQFDDDSIHWLEGHSIPQRGEDESVLWHGFITDITERKAAEDLIKQLAFYDPLTQLPNRRLLQERLIHGIELCHRTGEKMAVLMMDLDRFKEVNDSLGHAAGDELLKQVAQRIKEHLREMDTVARLGGDEFVIMLEKMTYVSHTAPIAEAIIYSLSQPFILYETHQVSIGASIGIAIYPEHGNSPEILLDHADHALYKAKEAGRGRFAYFSNL